MVKKIDHAFIKRVSPPKAFQRGLIYYQEDRVKDLSFDINYEVWTAYVIGTKTYFVEIDLTSSLKGLCNCPAFAYMELCKHCVAVLFAIAKAQHTSTEAATETTLTEKFMEEIALLSQGSVEDHLLSYKTPMHVKYELNWSYENYFYLTLKTGIDRMYVVRDIGSFLENVLSREEHIFTERFSFDPNRHYFLQRDSSLFQVLQRILNNEHLYRKQWLKNPYKNIQERRSLIVPTLLLEDLLLQLKERDLTVKIDQENYDQIDLLYDQLPYTLELTETTEHQMVLNIFDPLNTTFLKSYDILFTQGTFYFPKEHQRTIAEAVEKLKGRQTDSFVIPKDQEHVFVSEVLPRLEENVKVLFEPSVKERMVYAPLQAKLFLQREGDLILGQLEYHYGQYKIDPFQPKAFEDVIVVRQNEKEQQIMHFIEQAQFHYNGEALYMKVTEDELVHFLYMVIPTLEQYVDLHLDQRLQQLIVDEPVNIEPFVSMNETSDLLEVDFNMEGITEEDIEKVLQSVVEKKRYVRLTSGAFLSLEQKNFSKMKTFLEDLQISSQDLQQKTIEVPVYRGLQIDQHLLETNYDDAFQQLLQQLKAPEKQEFQFPEDIQANLRPYQKIGFQWFKSLSAFRLGGILADEMGLGKTLQSIAYMISEPSKDPHLIIAPSSVVYNWEKEFHKFAPHVKVAVIVGDPKQRLERMMASKSADVWITSYGMVRQDISYYRSHRFQSLILDEAQYIKNAATKTSRAIRQIPAKRRFALSGTPIENSIDELWAIFHVLLPGYLPKRSIFRQLPISKIRKMTKPFILRRLKKDVLKELPPMIESTDHIELTKEQKELYIGYLNHLQKETAQAMHGESFQKQRIRILAGLTRLRQICCHPSLFIDNYTGSSSKLERLMQRVKRELQENKRLLIFSQFTAMHQLIIRRLQKENIDYFYLQGSTPSKERLEMSERFNRGEKQVFLISLRAGGTGLNLTGADTVILYDSWWNPAVEDQAMGRAHRIGQKAVVHVHRLIAKGTIEEKIYELQQQKRQLFDQVVPSEETMLSSLTEEEIRFILNV